MKTTMMMMMIRISKIKRNRKIISRKEKDLDDDKMNKEHRFIGRENNSSLLPHNVVAFS